MDIMFKTRGPEAVSGQVLIVDIDEKSLKALGQWPWPRNILAALTRRLAQNNALAIGFDMVFAEKDRTSPSTYFSNLPSGVQQHLPHGLLERLQEIPDLDYDALFGDALSQAPTVLGYAFQTMDDGLKSNEDLPFPSCVIRMHPQPDDTDSGSGYDRLPLIRAYRAIVNHPDMAMAESEGFVNVFSDDSGTTRQVPLMMLMDQVPYPSLALETFRIGQNIQDITLYVSQKIATDHPPILGIQMGKCFIPTDSFGQLFVNYRGPSHSFQYISAVDVLTRDTLPPIKNKFILIGTSATGLKDLRTTPFSTAAPGVEINATIIDNLISSDPFNL